MPKSTSERALSRPIPGKLCAGHSRAFYGFDRPRDRLWGSGVRNSARVCYIHLYYVFQLEIQSRFNNAKWESCALRTLFLTIYFDRREIPVVKAWLNLILPRSQILVGNQNALVGGSVPARSSLL